MSGEFAQPTEYKYTGEIERTRQLHVCPDPNCGSNLVYPVDWQDDRPSYFRIWLRCPECHQGEEVIASIAQTERLDTALDQAVAEVLSDLRQITHANMSEEAEKFIGALAHDDILPEDF